MPSAPVGLLQPSVLSLALLAQESLHLGLADLCYWQTVAFQLLGPAFQRRMFAFQWSLLSEAVLALQTLTAAASGVARLHHAMKQWLRHALPAQQTVSV